MTGLIGGLSQKQYNTYLTPITEKKGICSKFVSNFVNFMKRLGYSICHGFSAYPNDAYLLKKFKTHQFSKMNLPQYRVATQIFARMEKSPDLKPLELKAVRDLLNAAQQRLMSAPVENQETVVQEQVKKSFEMHETSPNQGAVGTEQQNEAQPQENHLSLNENDGQDPINEPSSEKAAGTDEAQPQESIPLDPQNLSNPAAEQNLSDYSGEKNSTSLSGADAPLFVKPIEVGDNSQDQVQIEVVEVAETIRLEEKEVVDLKSPYQVEIEDAEEDVLHLLWGEEIDLTIEEPAQFKKKNPVDLGKKEEVELEVLLSELEEFEDASEGDESDFGQVAVTDLSQPNNLSSIAPLPPFVPQVFVNEMKEYKSSIDDLEMIKRATRYHAAKGSLLNKVPSFLGNFFNIPSFDALSYADDNEEDNLSKALVKARTFEIIYDTYLSHRNEFAVDQNVKEIFNQIIHQFENGLQMLKEVYPTADQEDDQFSTNKKELQDIVVKIKQNAQTVSV